MFVKKSSILFIALTVSVVGFGQSDAPCGAPALPVNAGCVNTAGTTAGATYQNNAANGGTPSCASPGAPDVWYSFVAPASGNVNITTSAGDMDTGMGLYNGPCGSPTQIACDDDGGVGTYSSITNGTLTPGVTYYIRVWRYSSGTGNFNICVTSLAAPPPPPTNISCAIPDPICSGSPVTFTAQANNTQADEVDPGNDYDCLFSQPNPSWYYLEIATSGNLVIDITAGSDVDYAIWGPFTDLTNAVANCNSYAVPNDCSFSASPIEQAVVNGVTAGQVYVLLVTNYANTVQTITVTDAPSNTATTDCSIVPLSVELTDFNGVNVDNEILLSWTTVSEQNNSHFVVERSVDASVWTAIAVENGAGTTTSTQHYSSIDRNPSSGDNYYRLKQFDFDGKMTISDIISVSSSSLNKVIVYPNPSNDRISVISNHEIISISIVDIRGTVVYSGNFDKVNSTTIELSDLNSGLYYLQTQTTSGTMTERIVVQH